MSYSADDEVWADIYQFPDYKVSNLGRIYNNRLSKIMQISYSQHGHAKVSLTRPGEGRWTRSVAVMVAEAFCPYPDLNCDQVIFLDGELDNLYAGNLAWRPSWYAWKYTRQLKVTQPMSFHNLPVRNIRIDENYINIIHAGMSEGILFEDIWRSSYTGEEVYPYGSVYEIVR